ncbi:hypothetical protein INR49_016130, partial [Caranx melampygus]
MIPALVAGGESSGLPGPFLGRQVFGVNSDSRSQNGELRIERPPSHMQAKKRYLLVSVGAGLLFLVYLWGLQIGEFQQQQPYQYRQLPQYPQHHQYHHQQEYQHFYQNQDVYQPQPQPLPQRSPSRPPRHWPE